MAELVGQQLGNYRLNGLLGRGGFAEVYLGVHIYLKTLAAIKVLHLQLTNQTQADFLNEARVIARLEHPHIVRVLEFGVERHVPFLVMSYAPHGTLRHHCPRGMAQAATGIIPYVKQIASALDYAHERKLIHRDVKPENVLLDASHKGLLSDFGLATISQSLNHEHLQDCAGTVAYMAPEQIQGKPCPASDQYALGVVVYEWLTGSWPFEGTDPMVAMQHLYAPPPSMCEKLPMLAPEIEQVVMRALSKDPDQRFPRVQDFALALEQAASGTASISSVPTLVPLQPVETRIPPVNEMGQSSKPPEFTTSERYRRESSTSQHTIVPKPVSTPQPIPIHPAQSPDSDVANLPPVSSAAEDVTRILPPQKTDQAKLAEPAEPSLPSSFPLSEPASPSPTAQLSSSPLNSNYRSTRRTILLSLAGAVAAGATGAGLTMLFFSSRFPGQPGISSARQQKSPDVPSASSTANTSTNVNTPAPTRTPASSPASAGTPSPDTPSPSVTPTQGATPTTIPNPAPGSPLSIQFENPPASLTNGQEARIDVLTSEPNVSVTLDVSYNVPSSKDGTTVMQTTDNNGQATLTWQVDVRGRHNDTQVEAMLNVSAVDMNGVNAQPQQLTIPVNV